MKTEAEFITLKCESAEATIAPERGAIVTSFRVHNRELLYFDQATFNDRSKNVRGGIPLLFPSPGKLENDRWRCADRSGELKQHGFARNLSWSIVGRAAQTNVTLAIESGDTTLRDYPWRFRACVTYELEPNALHLRFEIENRDATAMPFALGLHPYFAVADKSVASIPTRATRAFNNVSKTLEPFTGFDFTRDEVDLHLLDHDSASARLMLGDGSITIDCSPEFTRWVIWSLPGKDFICLEPWSAPGNALNTGEGLIFLDPGSIRSLFVRIST